LRARLRWPGCSHRASGQLAVKALDVAVLHRPSRPNEPFTAGRWRKEYGGLKVDQAKRLKELEQENGKLKRLVAELSLDKQILQDIARGNF
jgi:hypothetical protein